MYFLVYTVPMRWGQKRGGGSTPLHTFRLRTLAKPATLSTVSDVTVAASALWAVLRQRGTFRRGCACQLGRSTGQLLKIYCISLVVYHYMQVTGKGHAAGRRGKDRLGVRCCNTICV